MTTTMNSSYVTGARIDSRKRYNYDQMVFKVENPPCHKCHAGTLDFRLFEDLEGSGTDWIQWYCRSDGCGYYINVEIL